MRRRVSEGCFFYAVALHQARGAERNLALFAKLPLRVGFIAVVMTAVTTSKKMKLLLPAALTATTGCSYPCGNAPVDPPDVCLPDGGYPCMNPDSCSPERAADGGINYQSDGGYLCLC